MKKKNLTLLAIIAGIVVALGIAAVFFFHTNVWTGHSFISRNATSADLRGEELTAEEFDSLQNALPNCNIIWDVPFQGEKVSSTSQILTVSSLSREDLEMLSRFPQLTMLDATNCADMDMIRAFMELRPECQVLYQVTLNGNNYPQDAQTVTVTDANVSKLLEQLVLLKDLQQVTLLGQLPLAEDLDTLTNAFPQVAFLWSVEVDGQLLANDTAHLDLSASTLSADEIAGILTLLPELETIVLSDTVLTNDEKVALILSKPDCTFSCQIQVAGLSFSTDVEEMDISDQKVNDVAEIEALLPCFPQLKKVYMSNCGVDDETMYALDNRHENIRFVWTVYVQGIPLRTDTEYFYPYKMKPTMMVRNEDMEVLRYCPDVLCIDIGHMWYITDCEWVKYVPKLKWLILGETQISDLGPLASCKNLVYLEIFTIPVTDYSPLLGCTALEDLCLGRTFGDPTPLTQMTWLKHVWWANVHGTVDNPAVNAKAMLEAALPNTVLRFDIAHPTAGGWRKLDNYFAMRDLMDMHYLQ